MPLYEYLCHSCGKKFEVIQKFSDDPLTRHEECGGEVEKLISAPAFHFKGTGWYVTDYAKGNGGAPKSDGGKTDATARSEGDAKSGDSSKSDTSTSKPTESKPADSKATPSKATPSKSSDTKASSGPAPESK